MATWALITFLIGFLSFMFYLYDIFKWFVPFWGIIIMAIAFGMLTRIWHKEKEGEKEKLVQTIEELEDELAQLKSKEPTEQATEAPQQEGEGTPETKQEAVPETKPEEAAGS